ncbi:MAG: sigma-70 family RNA polymerase sigma factor, partial [Planctomycetota bacterium]
PSAQMIEQRFPVSRRGLSEVDAEDTVQGFFAELLRRDDLARVDAARGRFRSFLYTGLNRFLANSFRNDRAIKRGGATTTKSMSTDADHQDAVASQLIAPEAEAAREFDRQWALWVVEKTLDELQSEYAEQGKSEWFECFRQELQGEPSTERRRQLQQTLGISMTALKVAIHRLRIQYRRRLIQAIAETVEDPVETEAERAWLFKALG